MSTVVTEDEAGVRKGRLSGEPKRPASGKRSVKKPIRR